MICVCAQKGKDEKCQNRDVLGHVGGVQSPRKSHLAMFFKIIGPVSNVEAIASGKSIRERHRLGKLYGGRRWRKLRGTARIKLANGTICHAELHWYEAHGIGQKEFKIKRFLELDETK